VKFNGVLFRNHKCMAPAEGLDVQKRITCSLARWVIQSVPLCSLENFERRNFTFDDTAEDTSRHGDCESTEGIRRRVDLQCCTQCCGGGIWTRPLWESGPLYR
jgi:hypothetical protein